MKSARPLAAIVYAVGILCCCACRQTTPKDRFGSELPDREVDRVLHVNLDSPARRSVFATSG